MIALLVALIAAVELARRLPLLVSFRAMAGASLRARRVIARRGADRWKERAMQGASLRMLQASLTTGAMLALVIAPVAAVILLDPMLRLGARDALFDGTSRIIIAGVCVTYALVRPCLAALRLR